ncbi:hypothetical protein LJB92_01410, partial [Bacteroidales bacterium OttesenSCG-928-M06]|nr:hypothetical protein [Bacteroidales bacterium OttesenSCG-928-M06]
MNKQVHLFIITLLLLLATNMQATVRYVKHNGTTNATTAISWATACSDLQAVINISNEGDEIWVAAGTYFPTIKAAEIDSKGNATTDRDKAYVLEKGVKIYGGFAGTETSLEERNWESNKTILSGDIGTPEDASDNCYHIVISVGNVGDACLDGFTITGGNDDGSGYIVVKGKSVYRFGEAGICIRSSSPTFSNLIISNNKREGMSTHDSSSILTNVTITNNDGGGISSSWSSLILTNVTITENKGKGIYNNEGSPQLINAIIANNTEEGMYNNFGEPKLTNVAIYGNFIGIYNYASSPILTNVTISGNEDGGMVSFSAFQDGEFMQGSFPKIYNSIIWGNERGSSHDDWGSSSEYEYCLIEKLYPDGNGNLNGNAPNIDPKFVDADNEDLSKRNYNLRMGSSCINAGNNELNKTAFDLAGNPRISDNTIDMGAYESFIDFTPDPNGRVYVDKTKNGTGNSWGNAMPELADALQKAANINAMEPGFVKEIWVAAGTYKPLYTGGDGTTERDRAFVLIKDVKIYGGFNGTEATLKDRKMENSPSILSGDIGIPDDNSDNCYHVVVSAGNMGSACLDGFTISNGNANGSSSTTINNKVIEQSAGGGIYNSSSINFINLIISENTANQGGGMYNEASSSAVVNSLFFENTATTQGGGIY